MFLHAEMLLCLHMFSTGGPHQGCEGAGGLRKGGPPVCHWPQQQRQRVCPVARWSMALAPRQACTPASERAYQHSSCGVASTVTRACTMPGPAPVEPGYHGASVCVPVVASMGSRHFAQFWQALAAAAHVLPVRPAQQSTSDRAHGCCTSTSTLVLQTTK